MRVPVRVIYILLFQAMLAGLVYATCGTTDDWDVVSPAQDYTEWEPSGSLSAEGSGVPNKSFQFKFLDGNTGSALSSYGGTTNSEGQWGATCDEPGGQWPNGGWPPFTKPGEKAVSAKVYCNGNSMKSNQITFQRAA